MDQPITLWLPEDDFAAVTAVARPYGLTEEQQVAAWVAPFLAEARRHHHEQQWTARRGVLEARPDLAATVDAVVPQRGRP